MRVTSLPHPTPLFYPKWETGKFRLLGSELVAFVEEYKPRRNRTSVISLELGGDDVVEISSRKKSELFPDVKGERVRVTWVLGVTGSVC